MKGWKKQEREYARLFSVWWYPSNKDELKGIKADKLPFRRTPNSGAWDKVKAPCDLVVPDDFPFFVEVKGREKWDFNTLLKSNDPELIKWIVKEENNLEIEINNPSKQKGVILVFSKKFQPDYIMIRKNFLEYIYPEWESCKFDRIVLRKGENVFVLMLLEDFFTFNPDIFRNKYEKRNYNEKGQFDSKNGI